jgi:hypothetical protein
MAIAERPAEVLVREQLAGARLLDGKRHRRAENQQPAPILRFLLAKTVLIANLRLFLLKIRSEAEDRAVDSVESWVGTPAISLRRTPSQEAAIKLSKCAVWHSQDERYRRTHRRNSPNRWSGSEAFVAMVQTTDLRNRDDLPSRWCLDRAGVRAIFVQ